MFNSTWTDPVGVNDPKGALKTLGALPIAVCLPAHYDSAL